MSNGDFTYKTTVAGLYRDKKTLMIWSVAYEIDPECRLSWSLDPSKGLILIPETPGTRTKVRTLHRQLVR